MTAAPVPVPDVREAVAAALRAHGFWATHSDRWNDPDWQDRLWSEMADAVLAVPAIATALGLSDERVPLDVAAMTPPVGEPHAFVGRLDRWCEICDKPDRNPIHHGSADE